MRPQSFSRFLLIIFTFTQFLTHSQYNFLDWPYVKNDDLKQITYDFLSNQIAPRLNVTYLGENNSTYMQNVRGVIWLEGNHNLISLPVRLVGRNCNKVINVIFKVNTGISQSTLSPRTFSMLYQQCGIKNEILYDDMVKINGKNQRVYPLYSFKDLYFVQVDLLGTKFMWENNIKMVTRNGTFTLQFTSEQEEEQVNTQTLKMLEVSGQF